ncbi:hypothetical protein [Bradyrhizobium sp. 157]|nr:hypothetical protein [Bradyrhizobium sp. 157]
MTLKTDDRAARAIELLEIIGAGELNAVSPFGRTPIAPQSYPALEAAFP